MTPDKETIKQVVSLYKQWYSEQSDKPLPDYIEELLGYDPIEEFEQICEECLGKGGKA